jgi:signal transduction histidine kinase
MALAAVALLWAVFAWRLRQVAVRWRARLEASLEERERIARELHDTFLQSVQGLMLKFQSAMEKIPVGEPARNLMEKALDRADEVLVEGRTRVTALRRSAQERRDFTAAVKLLAEQAAEDATSDVRVTVEGESRLLHPVVAEEALRILAEALANALRHANARVITIEIIYSRRELVVRLVDDGRGFSADVLDAAAKDGHWGLAGMRERAEKIRAQLEISSRPSAGTSIELKMRASIAYASERRERRAAL